MARYLFTSLLLALLAATASAQQPHTDAYKWRFLQRGKDATAQIPTDFQVGVVYRLRQDIVVRRGGTASRVSPYWVSAADAYNVEQVKERQRDPQGVAAREAQALRQLGLNNPPLAVGTSLAISDLGEQSEDETVVTAGTLLRFRQIWMDRRAIVGTSVRPYAEVLDGPLKGKWVDIHSMTKTDRSDGGCYVNPEYLTFVGR